MHCTTSPYKSPHYVAMHYLTLHKLTLQYDTPPLCTLHRNTSRSITSHRHNAPCNTLPYNTLNCNTSPYIALHNITIRRTALPDTPRRPAQASAGTGMGGVVVVVVLDVSHALWGAALWPPCMPQCISGLAAPMGAARTVWPERGLSPAGMRVASCRTRHTA